jgi:hypothetical protein
MDNKEIIIQVIAQRIKEEQKKHEHSIPDWHEIAARKIYASLDINMKTPKISKETLDEFFDLHDSEDFIDGDSDNWWEKNKLD